MSRVTQDGPPDEDEARNEAAAVTECINEQRDLFAAESDADEWKDPVFRKRILQILGFPDNLEPGMQHVISPLKALPLLKKLRIVDQVTADQVAEVRAAIEAIPDLRTVLQQVTRLHPQYRNPRNFALHAGDELEPEFDGAILVTSHDAETSDLKLSLYAAGADSALRSKIYTVQTEQGEQASLQELIDKLDDTINTILNEWSNTRKRPKLLSNLRSVVENLQNAIVPKKTEARQRTARRANLTDNLGRINPSASLHDLRTALSLLQSRVKDTILIERYITEDDRDLVAIIHENENRLKRVGQKLSKITNNDLIRPGVQSEIREDERFFTSEAQAVSAALAAIRQECSSMHVKPFSVYAAVLETYVIGAQQTLTEAAKSKKGRQSRLRETGDQIARSWMVYKCIATHRRIENILLSIAEGFKVSPRETRALLQDTTDLVTQRQAMPDRSYPEMQKPFYELIGFLTILDQYLDRSKTPQPNRQQFRELLKSFNFETTLRSLCDFDEPS